MHTRLNSSYRIFVTFLKVLLGQYSHASPGFMCMSVNTISSSFDLTEMIINYYNIPMHIQLIGSHWDYIISWLIHTKNGKFTVWAQKTVLTLCLHTNQKSISKEKYMTILFIQLLCQIMLFTHIKHRIMGIHGQESILHNIVGNKTQDILPTMSYHWDSGCFNICSTTIHLMRIEGVPWPRKMLGGFGAVYFWNSLRVWRDIKRTSRMPKKQ